MAADFEHDVDALGTKGAEFLEARAQEEIDTQLTNASAAIQAKIDELSGQLLQYLGEQYPEPTYGKLTIRSMYAKTIQGTPSKFPNIGSQDRPIVLQNEELQKVLEELGIPKTFSSKINTFELRKFFKKQILYKTIQSVVGNLTTPPTFQQAQMIASLFFTIFPSTLELVLVVQEPFDGRFVRVRKSFTRCNLLNQKPSLYPNIVTLGVEGNETLYPIGQFSSKQAALDYITANAAQIEEEALQFPNFKDRPLSYNEAEAFLRQMVSKFSLPFIHIRPYDLKTGCPGDNLISINLRKNQIISENTTTGLKRVVVPPEKFKTQPLPETPPQPDTVVSSEEAFAETGNQEQSPTPPKTPWYKTPLGIFGISLGVVGVGGAAYYMISKKDEKL